jgi:hypothetical protein
MPFGGTYFAARRVCTPVRPPSLPKLLSFQKINSSLFLCGSLQSKLPPLAVMRRLRAKRFLPLKELIKKYMQTKTKSHTINFSEEHCSPINWPVMMVNVQFC